jgi:O-antigen ligase
VAIAGVAYAIYGLVMELGGEKLILGYPKWAYRDSLTSTLVNRNAYAVAAGLALLAALALLVGSVRGSRRYAVNSRTGFADFLENLPPATFLLIGMAATVATALVLTRSRGGVAATAVGIPVLALAFALRRGGARQAIVIGIGALIGGGAVLAVSGKVLFDRIASEIGRGTGREAIHALTIEAIRDRPLLGHGLGSFPDVFSLYRDERFAWDVPAFREAHSTYLELACELGIPAAALLVAAAIAVALMCLVGALRRRQARIYPCLGLAAAALVGFQALFDFAIQIPAVAVTFAAIAGVAVAQSYRTEER